MIKSNIKKFRCATLWSHTLFLLRHRCFAGAKMEGKIEKSRCIMCAAHFICHVCTLVFVLWWGCKKKPTTIPKNTVENRFHRICCKIYSHSQKEILFTSWNCIKTRKKIFFYCIWSNSCNFQQNYRRMKWLEGIHFNVPLSVLNFTSQMQPKFNYACTLQSKIGQMNTFVCLFICLQLCTLHNWFSSSASNLCYVLFLTPYRDSIEIGTKCSGNWEKVK